MKWILSLIIALFLSISAYCEILQDGTKFNLYTDFTGGLNTRDPPHKLQVDESPYIRNCYIDEGEIDPVLGSIILGSTNTLTKVNLYKRFVKTNGDVEFIVSDSSIVLKTQDFNSYTLLKSGLASAYRTRAKQIEGKMYFTNGSDSPWTYNGSTVVVLDGKIYNVGKTPNMPKFKYIEYYQNRLWGFNTLDNESSLRWHLLNSTDVVPIALAPDSEWAWSNSNLQLNIDKGNGTAGTFLRVYAGQLFVGKERGIHYIYGNDDTNYSAIPIVKDYGFLSDESVVEQDNVLLGLGNNGVYEFNGQQMTRISDKIFPDIQKINSGVNKTNTLSYDTQSDFEKGNFYGTTATANGYLKLISSVSINDQQISGTNRWEFQSTGYNTALATSTNFLSLTYRDLRFGNTFFGYIGYVDFTAEPNGNAGTVIGSFTVTNSRTGQTVVSTFQLVNGGETDVLLSSANESGWVSASPVRMYPSNFVNCSLSDLYLQHVKFKLDFSTPNSSPGWIISVASINLQYYATVRMYNSSGLYVSEISTTTGLSAWGTFNSENNLNGGNINYFIKTASSSVNIATYPFTLISPGSIIGSSVSNTYIQWATTITGNNTNIDNVKIYYQIGGGSDINALGASWKNRYYLCVTTTSLGDTSLIYVKSRSGTKNPYGWTVIEGINAKSFLITPDIFYVGSSTAGSFMQMDYGTSFNGLPINQIYETNDNNFEQPFMNKNILEYGIDCDVINSSTFTLSTSIDRGSYSDLNINNSGSEGRMIRRISSPFAKGNSFKWRFSNSQLDKPMRIYNWIAYFKENATRTNIP